MFRGSFSTCKAESQTLHLVNETRDKFKVCTPEETIKTPNPNKPIFGEINMMIQLLLNALAGILVHLCQKVKDLMMESQGHKEVQQKNNCFVLQVCALP